jgi:hypothetical protein
MAGRATRAEHRRRRPCGTGAGLPFGIVHVRAGPDCGAKRIDARDQQIVAPVAEADGEKRYRLVRGCDDRRASARRRADGRGPDWPGQGQRRSEELYLRRRAAPPYYKIA